MRIDARIFIILAAATLTLPACRDAAPVFTPTEREPNDGPVRQLTFGYGQDLDPRWSVSGDSVLYHSSDFGTLPQARGVLLNIAPTGGVAAPLFADMQRTGARLLATPAYSPQGDRVAYMDLVSVDAPSGCSTPLENPPAGVGELCFFGQPLLDSAVLRVRRVDEVRDVFLDPWLPVKFDGTAAGVRFAQPGPHFQRAHPFQALHRAEHVMLFRPTWSPDGQRLVFSDGLRLLMWRVGDAAATVVPNTVDGVSPAWSPDGQWLAFTWLERGDSSVHSCLCGAIPNQERHDRVLYTITARTIVRVRPDGSERTVLGPGEDPAWSPNGQHLYVRRNDRIVRIGVADDAVVTIADTERGRLPAVSPDGRWLSFARRKPQVTTDYDIWVVSLP